MLGRTYPEEVLSRALYTTQFIRHLDRHEYVRFKYWRLFGENGLAGEEVSVWVYEDTVKVEHQATTLSLYSVRLSPDQHQITEVKSARRPRSRTGRSPSRPGVPIRPGRQTPPRRPEVAAPTHPDPLEGLGPTPLRLSTSSPRQPTTRRFTATEGPPQPRFNRPRRPTGPSSQTTRVDPGHRCD